MPFEPTWTREQLNYLERAYQQDIPAKEMQKVLNRNPAAISEQAKRLNLTDPDRAKRIRYKTGHAKINDATVAIIEELIVDWGYSARKMVKVLKAEHNLTVSKTAVLSTIHERVSEKARTLYRRKFNKYHHKTKR